MTPRASAFDCAALLFDMDGVLVDSTAAIARVWRRWAALRGVDPEPLLRASHSRRTSDVLRAAALELDVAREVAWLDAAELAEEEGLRAVAGAPEFVAALPARRWAVVTSSGRALAGLRLARAGLPTPAVLVTSEDVPRGKPAPDGYLEAARRIAERAEECLAFEDAPPGVAAARAAGARVIGIATTHAADELLAAGAAAAVPDFRALRVRAGAEGLTVEVA